MANTSVRITYMRVDGYVQQNYDTIEMEDEANDMTTNEPLIGIYSAFANYMVKFLNQRGLATMLVKPKVRAFGKPDENGTFDGIIGLLQNNEADFTSLPYQFNIPGNPVAVTQTLAEAKGLFLQSFPIKDETPMDFLIQLYEVYDYDTLLCTFTAILLVALLLLYRSVNPAASRCRFGFKSFKLFYEKLGHLCRAPLNQGVLSSNATMTRLTIVCFLVTVMVIISVALNSIGAKMVVNKENIIESLEELLINKDMNVIWWSVGSALATFRNKDSSAIAKAVFHEFGHRANSIKEGFSLDQIIDLITAINKPNTVYIEEYNTGSVISSQVCSSKPDNVKLRLTEVDGMDIQYGFSYNPRVSHQLREWIEFGAKRVFEAGFTDLHKFAHLVKHLNTDRYQLSGEKCYDKDDDQDLRQLSLKDYGFLFKVLYYSCGITIVCNIIEISTLFRKERKLRKRRRRRRVVKTTIKLATCAVPEVV